MPSGGVRGVNGALIRDTRVNMGMSQAELGLMSGCSGASVSRIENNDQMPGPELLQRITQSLSILPRQALPGPVAAATLRQVRKTRLGLSLVAVADLAGLTHGHLSLIERGIAKPRDPAAVARAYSVGLEEFDELWQASRAAEQHRLYVRARIQRKNQNHAESSGQDQR